MQDFHVLLDGAAHIHRAEEPPKIGDVIPLNADTAEIYGIAEGDDGTSVFMAKRIRADESS